MVISVFPFPGTVTNTVKDDNYVTCQIVALFGSYTPGLPTFRKLSLVLEEHTPVLSPVPEHILPQGILSSAHTRKDLTPVPVQLKWGHCKIANINLR
ncbi:hypothetical protein ACROYT_G007791 [Oculina patagonica]